MSKIEVQGRTVDLLKIGKDEYYISLTDIARYRNPDEPKDVVKNWMRSRSTVEFLGLWETLNNADFKGVEFDPFLHASGSNAFTLSPQKWITATNAIGIIAKSGRNGGTFAHKDIAFEFASWISVEFKLYLIKEFQRLKEVEQKQLGWDIKRNLAKINYVIHTDAIKEHLIPAKLTRAQQNMVYASEVDILNMALFGMTAAQWRKENPDQKGNIRDYANISQLICLSNLENLNALIISEHKSQPERLAKLNDTAIAQMKLWFRTKVLS
jgi:hypothetical protein